MDYKAGAALSNVILDALDAMTVAPAHHDVLLENERVRVLDTRLGPGERTPVHTHQWPSALYVMRWSDFVRHDMHGAVIVDSRTWERRPEPGEALWSAPLVPHWVENVGDDELRIIAIEIKPD
jgi:quercetin dioxygenase-like cupin family protein